MLELTIKHDMGGIPVHLFIQYMHSSIKDDELNIITTEFRIS